MPETPVNNAIHFEQKVRRFITKNSLLSPNDTVIVGVSGGADSVALSYCLYRLGWRIVITHCNFQLRGSESDDDEVFVKNWAQQLGVPYAVRKIQITHYYNLQKVSTQEEARLQRYDFFQTIAAQYASAKIGTAHHADDNLETILFNLTKGTAIKGLLGIAPKNKNIIRPFLHLSETEIQAYLQANQLSFRMDSSNETDTYMRNKIRHHVVPTLKEINPSLTTTFTRNASYLSDVFSIYQSALQQMETQITSTLNDIVYINISALMSFVAWQTVLYEIIAKKYGFNSLQVAQICSSVQHIGATFYSRQFRLTVGREALIIQPQKNTLASTLIHSPTEEIQILDKRIKFRVIENNAAFRMVPSLEIAYLDFDKIILPATLRYYQQGDYFLPLGMNGKRQLLSDFFTNKKFNVVQKKQTPLLVNSNGEICWVVGQRLDERYKLTEATQYIWEIQLNDV
ncbi:MAG: tRNA lysidine(34) synthetase TilS [Saprospiraceae bacterium]|nr:tRNA lysidine(34) synthetase TilS [Saprospiraceae bacterium]MBP7699377.1 tRNA lysidine(34) synthetase TilS [Saprospiraceae bacterium]